MIKIDLFQYCLDTFGYDEPILTEELRDKVPIKDSALRTKLKRLVDNGRLERYSNGIYFIPKPNSLLKKMSLPIKKVIRKKYLYAGNKPVGYETGIAFANRLNLTTQTAGVIDVVTNIETNRKRTANINNWRIILRKPRAPIEKENIKVLQVLDLLSNFEQISEKSLEDSSDIVKNYLRDVKIDEKELNEILKNYSKNTIINATKSTYMKIRTFFQRL